MVAAPGSCAPTPRDVGLDEVRPRLIANGTSEAPNWATSNPSRAHGLSALWFSGNAGKNAFSAGTDLQLNTIEAFQDSSFVGEVPTVLTFTEGEQRLAGIFVQDVLQATSRLALTLDGRFDWVETLDGRRVETNQRTGASLETILVDSKTEHWVQPEPGSRLRSEPRRARAPLRPTPDFAPARHRSSSSPTPPPARRRPIRI